MSSPSIVTPRISKKRRDNASESNKNSIKANSNNLNNSNPRVISTTNNNNNNNDNNNNNNCNNNNNNNNYRGQSSKFKFLKDLSSFKLTGQQMQGRFGIINIVTDESNKKYAAKTCKYDPKCEHLFLREISLLIHIQNQLIVPFVGFAFNDFDGNSNSITIIMDYIENGSLADLLQKQVNNKCPQDYNDTERQKILVGISGAMHHLHKRHIVHRDLKPENILIGKGYNIKLTDFGQSRILDDMNESIKNFGTAPYLAPESIEYSVFSQKTDVYAFGILMYEVLSGTRAYSNIIKSRKLNALTLQQEVLNKHLRPEFNFPIKPGLKKLIEACWSTDPKKRPTFLEIFNKLSMSVNEHIIDFEDDDYEKVLAATEEDNDDDLPFMKYCLDNVDHRELFLFVEEILDIDNSNNEIKELKNKIEELSNNNSNNEIRELRNIINELRNDVKNLNSVRRINRESNNNINNNNNDKIRKIKVQNPVEQNGLIEQCKELKKMILSGTICDIKLPNELLFVPQKQFENCYSLKSVEIPPSVISIKREAFINCCALTKVVIPPSVKVIEFNAFKGCRSLKCVEIKSELESIGLSAFYDCVCLETINIPPTITSIEETTFYNCTSLENIMLPPSIKSIQCRSFFGCSKLKKITIPEGNTIIKEGTFNGCKSLIKVVLPQSLTKIDENAFYGCVALTNINIPENLESIGNSAFHTCTSLKTINIPENLKSIGDSVFNNCTSLKTINIPDSVESIGDSVFNNCTSLTKINIPSSVKEMGVNLFTDCSSLTSVTIGPGIKTITPQLFKGCKKLVEVKLPSTYTSIDDYAFSDCSSLLSFKCPSSLKKISNYAFNNCTSLQNIILSSSLESIESYAFSNCTSLQDISFPKTLQNIGKLAFNHCISLKKLDLSRIKLNDCICSECKSLSEVTINADQLPKAYFLYDCNENLKVILRTSQKALHLNEKFFECIYKIGYIVVPDNVNEFSIYIPYNYYYHNNYNYQIKGIFNPKSVQMFSPLLNIRDIIYDPYSTDLVLTDKLSDYRLGTKYSNYHLIMQTDHQELDDNVLKKIAKYGSYVKELTISSPLKSIKSDMGKLFPNITKLNISPDVKSIESNAFTACTYLTSLTFDPYKTLIKPNAFPSEFRYTFVLNISTDKEKIDGNIIQRINLPMNTIKVSGQVKTIEPNTFSCCSKLVSIELSPLISTIGDYAFKGCTGLINVKLPDSLKKIGDNAFQGCSAMYDIKIPSSLESIGQNAFYGCSNLAVSYLPPSLKYIGQSAFDDCQNIQRIHISKQTQVDGDKKIYLIVNDDAFLKDK